jgi:hypothetical protein
MHARMRAGITLSKAELERLSELARAHGAWLVLDDTYESFLFSGEPHHCPQGPHVIHVFSFSKACPPLPERPCLTPASPASLPACTCFYCSLSAWQ